MYFLEVGIFRVIGCNICLPVMSGTYVNEPVFSYLDHGEVRVECVINCWSLGCGGEKVYK